MNKIRYNRKAASMVEYTMLLVILIAAFVAGRQYVLRAFAGRWKASADSFGYGMQYHPKKTADCTWSKDFGKWYDDACYDPKWERYSRNYFADCLDHCAASHSGDLYGPCNAGPFPDAYCCYCSGEDGWNCKFAECCHGDDRYLKCDISCCQQQCRMRCDYKADRQAVEECPNSKCN